MSDYSYDIANYIPILKEFAQTASFLLEIGPAKGDGSTLGFSEVFDKKDPNKVLFISVDHQDYMDIKPKGKYWHLVLGDSRETETLHKVEKIAGRGKKADLIFIDTHHTREQIEKELPIWVTMAHDKTQWLFHDTYMMGEYNPMTDAIKEFAQKNGWIYEDLRSDAHGLGYMYK